jgi:hypothetical protein
VKDAGDIRQIGKSVVLPAGNTTAERKYGRLRLVSYFKVQV